MDVFHASPQPMSQEHYSPPSFSHPQAYSDDYRIRSVPESARNSEYSRTDFTRPERGRQYGSSNRDLSSPDYNRIARPAQVYSEDHMSSPQHPSPQWGPVHVSRFSQQSFETPIQSRSASPTLVSGRVTPMSRLPQTKLQQDSWPNTPMVSFRVEYNGYCSIMLTCLAASKQCQFGSIAPGRPFSRHVERLGQGRLHRSPS